MALVVWPLVDHPGAALHPGRVAATQVGVEVGAVPVALIPATLVVAVLVENDLDEILYRFIRSEGILNYLKSTESVL